jgi:hypothetical protein
MDYDEVTYEEGDDWVEKVYNEDGIKVTRYKPSWYKDFDMLAPKPLKSKSRKPSFGPKDP